MGPLAFVILMGIYGYWSSLRALDSSRPVENGETELPAPVPTPGIHTFHARMWEDPLSTSWDHWAKQKDDPSKAKPGELRSLPDSDDLDKAMLSAVLGELAGDETDGTDGTSKAPGKTHGATVATDLAMDKTVEVAMKSATNDRADLKEPDSTKSAKTRERATEHNQTGDTTWWTDRDSTIVALRRKALRRKQEENTQKFFQSLVDERAIETTCVPVFAPGGPYAEDKETRMRVRYAVVTALAEAGYNLKYPRRMSYLISQVFVRVLRGWQERQIVVPVKLYRHADQKKQVIVLWINEAELGLRPLLATHRILNSIFAEVSNGSSLKITPIGPASSDTLSNMAAEIAHVEDTYFANAVRVLEGLNRSGRLTVGHCVRANAVEITTAARSISRWMKAVNWWADQSRPVRAKYVVKTAFRQLEAIKEVYSAVTENAASHIQTECYDCRGKWNALGDGDSSRAMKRAILAMESRLRDIVEELDGRDEGDNTKSLIYFAERVKLHAAQLDFAVNYALAAGDWRSEDESDVTTARALGQDELKRVLNAGKTGLALDPTALHWLATPESPNKAKAIGSFSPMLNSEGPIEVFSPRATTDINFELNDSFVLRRVVGTDNALARALQFELEKRGAANGRIVLINEHDTAYGRAFPNTFSKVGRNDVTYTDHIKPIVKSCNSCHTFCDVAVDYTVKPCDIEEFHQATKRDDATNDVKNGTPVLKHCHPLAVLAKRLEKSSVAMAGKGPDIHFLDDDQRDVLASWGRSLRIGDSSRSSWEFSHFKILRGIDGHLPDGSAQNKQSLGRAGDSDGKVVERPPEGRSQYDYLKRLRARIEQFNDVTAIGVVGTDVYDKLLVLRELKPHFPDCVFFTTDLDAIYAHPEERKHTRNLIIASHYDLELRACLQGSTPPFRDSYQASTFLATRLAVLDQPGNEGVPEENVCELCTSESGDGIKDETPQNILRCVMHKLSADDESTEKLHIVGAAGFHQLSGYPESDPESGQEDAGSSLRDHVHPELPSDSADWHYLFVGIMACIVAGITACVAYRDQLHESIKAEESDAPWLQVLVRWWCDWVIKRVSDSGNRKERRGLAPLGRLASSIRRFVEDRHNPLESSLNIALSVLLSVGVGLFICVVVGVWNDEMAGGFFDGIFTWPRKMVYSVVGILATLSLMYVINDFRNQRSRIKARYGRDDVAIERLNQSWPHLVRVSVLALVVFYLGITCVFRVRFANDTPDFVVANLIAFGLLGVLWCLFGRKKTVAVCDRKWQRGVRLPLQAIPKHQKPNIGRHSTFALYSLWGLVAMCCASLALGVSWPILMMGSDGMPLVGTPFPPAVDLASRYRRPSVASTVCLWNALCASSSPYSFMSISGVTNTRGRR